MLYNPAVSSFTQTAIAVTDEWDYQTGDSGFGTGSGSVQYPMKDFLPGILSSGKSFL